MKYLLLIAVLLVGCGKDSTTMYQYNGERRLLCVDGVIYIQLGSAWTAKFDRYGKVETCQ